MDIAQKQTMPDQSDQGWWFSRHGIFGRAEMAAINAAWSVFEGGDPMGTNVGSSCWGIQDALGYLRKTKLYQEFVKICRKHGKDQPDDPIKVLSYQCVLTQFGASSNFLTTRVTPTLAAYRRSDLAQDVQNFFQRASRRPRYDSTLYHSHRQNVSKPFYNSRTLENSTEGANRFRRFRKTGILDRVFEMFSETTKGEVSAEQENWAPYCGLMTKMNDMSFSTESKDLIKEGVKRFLDKHGMEIRADFEDFLKYTLVWEVNKKIRESFEPGELSEYITGLMTVIRNATSSMDEEYKELGLDMYRSFDKLTRREPDWEKFYSG